MGVRRGSLSFTRFRVKGDLPKDLRRRFLDAVRLRVFAPLDVNDEAMESSGWCVLERPFELEFDESNLYFDRYVLLGFRVDKWRIPGTLVKAQLEDEEQKLLGRAGRARLGRAEKADLKQKIIMKLRRKILPNARSYDVLWDLDGQTLLFFGHSSKLLLDFAACFEKTFSLTLEEDCPYFSAMRSPLPTALKKQLIGIEPLSLVSGHKRLEIAKKGELARVKEKAAPAGKVNDDDPDTLIERIETTRFLGSEFLLWIWLYGSLIEDTVTLGKNDEWTIWLDGALALESVHDPSEKVSVRGAAPSTSSEAREAVKNYKFPARAKVILRQEERDFKFVLNAARFSLSAGDIPAVLQQQDDGLLERLHLLEELLNLVDKTFAAFLQLRLSNHWQEAWEPAIAAWANEIRMPPVLLQALNKSVRDLARSPKR
ncbi:MAG: recombination-associated protein RdgC [Polyangiaceae bacterium]